MTEQSYFHNGTAAGDATIAPYDQDTFAYAVNALHSSGAHVLPDQLNNLEVTTSAGRAVSVNTGRALVYGYWYENDAAATITLSANTSGFNRLDLIVVQINTDDNTASIVVLEGAPSTVADVPEANTCETLLELPLAIVCCPSGFASTSSKYIYDQRRFLDNTYHLNNYSRQNDFPNGLFKAWCDSENSGPTRRPMPGWKFSGSGTAHSVKDAERWPTMRGGRCVQYYTAPSVATNGFAIDLFTSDNYTDMFTFSMYLQVNEGQITVALGATSIEYVAADTVYHVIIRGSITGNKTLKISGSSGNAKFGDLRMAQGYCCAVQETNGPQVVMFDEPVYLNLENDGTNPTLTGVSTGTATIYWRNFGAVEDVYSLGTLSTVGQNKPIVQLRVNDSGSASTNPCWALIPIISTGTGLNHTVRADVGNAVNDYYRYETGAVMVYPLQYPYMSIEFTASGAGTMDVDVSVVGMII